MPVDARHYVTPPTYARRLGCKPATVLGWIKSGELSALQIGSGVRRPRFRISPEAIEEFERRRSVVKPQRIVRRKSGGDYQPKYY